jgi:signal peptidase I
MLSSLRSFLNSWLTPLAWGLGTLVLTQTFAGMVAIPSGSMEPTMARGDYLLVNRVAYGLHVPFTADKEVARWGLPKRGEIVIFNALPSASASEVLFIKRVVGLPGDIVEVVNDRVKVNGSFVTYEGADIEVLGNIRHHIKTGASPLANKPALRVPEGHIFVMGDHRNNSADSRAWGPLPLERVRGKAVFRLFGPTQGPRALD